MKQIDASVISNREALPGVFLLWLDAKQIAAEAKPGQFVMVGCGGDTILPRPFSIHQIDSSKVALLIAAVGKGSEWLSKRQVGDSVNIFGPLGNGFSISVGSKNLLLVAGGIGISPLLFLADRARSEGYSVKGIRGANAASQLLPNEFLPQYQMVWPAATTLVGDKGTIKGLVTDILPEYVKKTDQIFACGPLPMYRTMSKMKALKNKSVQVSLEIVMGCGRGVCYGCTIKTKTGLKKVCEDGPVFEMKDIIWDELATL